MLFSNGFVEIKHSSQLYENEDFVLAQQSQQFTIHVYAIIDPSRTI